MMVLLDCILDMQNNAMSWKLDLFPSSDEGLETPTVLDPLERIGPYAMFNQSDQPAQFGHFSHVDPPYQE
jgi:hypothetical protein